jgi:hypothetical protein
MKLRLSHLEQLDGYLNHIKNEGWYYGNKNQFDARHEHLQRFVDILILEHKQKKAIKK